MGRVEPYSIGISRWEWMKAALVVAVDERHEGQLRLVVEELELAEGAVRGLLIEARLAPAFSSVAKVAVDPASWERMLGRMLLAVVAVAPSHRAAGYILGLTRRELREQLRRARRLTS